MSKTIKEILASLDKNDLELLKYAFENSLTNQFVEYEDGRFIGVNIDPSLKAVRIEQIAGRYSEGTIRGTEDKGSIPGGISSGSPG